MKSKRWEQFPPLFYYQLMLLQSPHVLSGIKVGISLLSDADDVKENIMYSLEDSPNLAHVPYSYGNLLCISAGGYYKYVQICFCSDKIATRRFSNNEWSAWRQVSLT